MTSFLDETIGKTLTTLANRVQSHGFEAVRDAVSAWGDAQADDENAPDWHEMFASRLRAALDICEDVHECRDTCHVTVVWSDADAAFDAAFPASGAGPKLGPVVERAVARAIAGLPAPGEAE